MYSKKKVLLSILLFTIPVGLLVVSLLTRSGRFNRMYTPAIVANQTYRQTIAEWNGKKFIEVQSTAHLVRELSNVPFIGEAFISGEMRTELMHSLGSMLAGYNDRDYNQYRSFRILSDSKAKPKSIDWQRKQLIDKYRMSADRLPGDADSIHKLFFERAFASRLTKQCFRLFSPLDSVIEVESCQSAPKSFSEFFDKRKNAGLQQYIGTYQGDLPKESEFSSSAPLIIATCVFLVKIESFNDPCPFACRFYWDTKLRKWRPTNLGLAYVGPCPVDFVF
jgi:hypothetical protein